MPDRLCCANVAHIFRIYCNCRVAVAGHCIRRATAQGAHLPLARLRFLPGYHQPPNNNVPVYGRRKGDGAPRLHSHTTGTMAAATTSAIPAFSDIAITAAVSARVGLERPLVRFGIVDNGSLPARRSFQRQMTP
jgi:hypothetical protein